MHPGRPHGRKESGSVIVLTAVMATVLFGVMGMAIEVAGFYSLKRKMQTAADAGARSGAIEIWKDSANVDAEARRGATQNGYTDGTDGATVTVNRPPLNGDHAGDNGFAEVIIAQIQPLHLIRILSNTQTTTVRARAVGGTVPREGGSVVVLNPTAQDAFLASGGSTIDVAGGITINSNHATKALDLTGGSTVTGGYINVVGGDSGCGCTPPALNGVAPLPDPLASVQAPTYSSTCDYTNYTVGGGTVSLGPATPGGKLVMCGGIKVQGGATLNLDAGLYILLGGGLTVSPGHINGTGVTFYNTYDVSHSFGVLNLSGGSATAVLSAPSSGALTGMLFFTDRTAPSGSVNNLQGGGSLSFTGAMYFKTQKVKWSGGSTAEGPWTMIIADRLEFSGGNTNLGNDYTGPVKVPTRAPALVE